MSSGGETDIDTGAPGRFRTQSYFTASHDGGRSFGTVYATDAPDWPQQGRASVAAGHGALAEIYVASRVPASENASCPCQVFGISRDEGKTFERHVMKNIVVPPQGAGRGGRAWRRSRHRQSDRGSHHGRPILRDAHRIDAQSSLRGVHEQ